MIAVVVMHRLVNYLNSCSFATDLLRKYLSPSDAAPCPTCAEVGVLGMGDIRNSWWRLSCVKISRYSILSR